MLKVLEVTEQDIKTVKDRLREISPIYELEANIHDHTRKLGAECKIFLELDDKYEIFFSVGSDSSQAIYNEIKLFADNDANVVEALTAIQNAGDSLETETGLNVQNLLIRSWRLSDHCFASANMKELIVDNLKHNKATGGGCLAGIAARLTQPYCCGIGFIIDGVVRNKSCMNSATYLDVNKKDDNFELEMAIALSLSSNDSSEKKRKFIDVDNNYDNDDDFQKALILSRQSQQEEQDFAKAIRLSLQAQVPAKRFRK